MTSSPLDKRSSLEFSSRDAHSQLSCCVAESIEMHSLSDRSDLLSLPTAHVPSGEDIMEDTLNDNKLSSVVSVNSDHL
jgi:hypothetical protein